MSKKVCFSLASVGNSQLGSAPNPSLFLYGPDKLKQNDHSVNHDYFNQGLRAFYDAADVPEVTGDMTSSRLNFYDLVKEITRQLDTHLKDDPIFDWVEAKTTPQERTQPVFLRALVTAVCNKAIIQGEAVTFSYILILTVRSRKNNMHSILCWLKKSFKCSF